MLRRTLVAPSLAVAAAIAAPLAAQVQLRDALPENTILYVGAPDLDRAVADMKDMPLMRMWREAEVQDFFAELLEMVEAKVDEALAQGREMHKQGMLPFDPDSLMKLRVHGFGFALTTMKILPGEKEEGSDRPADPMPHFGVVAQVDFGPTAAQWRKIIEFAIDAIEKDSRGMLTKEVGQVGEATLVTLVPPETDMSLNFAFAGDGMVFGTIKSEVTKVLENIEGGAKVLSASHNFKKTFAQLDTQGSVMECYFQPGPLIDFGMGALKMASEMEPDFPMWLDVAGIGRAVDALGLRSVNAVGGTTAYVSNGDNNGNRSVSKGFCYAPAPTRKGLLGGGNKTLDMRFLSWVPKDAASFGARTFDLASVYAALVGALKAYDEQMAEGMLAQLAAREKQLGVNIKEDLISSLGNQYMSWSMPMAALGTTPEMAILVEVKDQQKLLQTLQTVAKLSRGTFEIDKSERRGITVYQLQINWDPTGGMGMMNPLDMFIPTFSFKDGYLVAGFSTGDVKRVFKRMDREDDPSGDIRSNPEFEPYLASIPKEGIYSVGFSDWKANFEGIYQAVTSFAAFIPVDDNIPIDLSLLPDVQTLTQHLFGSVAWSQADGEGFHGVSQGPWGPETVMLLCGAVGAGVGTAAAVEHGMIPR